MKLAHLLYSQKQCQCRRHETKVARHRAKRNAGSLKRTNQSPALAGRLNLILVFAFLIPFCVSASAGTRKPETPNTFVSHFLQLDVDKAKKEAEATLLWNPQNVSALFVRMETAELQAQPATVLDSALRLCRTSAPNVVQEIASNRVLRNAANTRVFTNLLPRIRLAARQENGCTLNLKLALVAAASDGLADVNVDQAAAAAGLAARWHIAGPFGHYSNAEFDRAWPSELNHSTQGEEFWFRDGMINLPDYLAVPGVLYASSEVQVAYAQSFLLDVLSAGTYSVFVDGKPVFTHDARYTLRSGRDGITLKLAEGRHSLLLKFTAEAAPLRVAIHPQAESAVSEPPIANELRPYVEALQAYMNDDQPAVERRQTLLSGRMAEYMKALLYSDSEGRSSEAEAAWEALSPLPLARIRLVQIALNRGEYQEHKQEITDLAAALPDAEAVQQLVFEVLHNEEPLQRLLALHPSCAYLGEAMDFYSSGGRQDEAEKMESRLAGCAPESLEYVRKLSAAGEHDRAAKSLLKLLEHNPLHRMARRTLVEELLLSGHEQDARQQAQRLHEIAPGSAVFARLAKAPDEVLDSRSNRAAGFTEQKQFYLPYRRDGLKIIRNAAERRFAGGPSVTILSDKAVKLAQDGSVSVYIHRITRVLNKDGITRFGEAAIPRAADLLELRTVKANGQIIEPELTQQKPTISMPALEPGDSIEEEFVMHYAGWDETADDTGKFVFGSFTSPILYARFTVITPDGSALNIFQPRSPAVHVEHAGGRHTYLWEQENILQAYSESSVPAGDLLPTVTVAPEENARARLRDEVMESTRAGLRVLEVARTFEQPGITGHEQAQRLYRFVTTKISSSADWNTITAEDTLVNSEGSRTATLLALSHALGLKTSLLLARKTGHGCSGASDLNCYTEPLVRFWFADGKTVDVDAESGGLSFGAFSATLDREDALLVSLNAQAEDEGRQLHVSLTRDSADEKSLAEGDLLLESNGNLSVKLHVRLGLTRSQQVRAILHNANQHERQAFFEQLAMRIFPEAWHVSGSSVHEGDPGQPMEINMECSVSQLLDVQNGTAELDQLVPALGLRGLYAKSATRKFPLLIDAVFFESTIFHLHLPAGLRVRSLPSEFTARNEFGEYSVRFSTMAQQINIERDFRIPVQVIAPEKYEAFASFARQIDDAERRRISLVTTSKAAL